LHLSAVGIGIAIGRSQIASESTNQVKPLNFMKKLIIFTLAAFAPLASYAGNYSFTTTGLNNLAHDTAYTWSLTDTTTNTTAYTSLLNDVKNKGMSVGSATLTISNIYDWQVEAADVLYVNILAGLTSGAISSYAWAATNTTPETTYGSNAFVAGTAANLATVGHGLAFTNAGANSLLTYGGSYTMAGNPGTWSDPYGSSAAFGGVKTAGTAETAAQGFNLVVTFNSLNLACLKSLLVSDTTGSGTPNVGLGFGPDCHFYDTGVTLTVVTVPESSSTLVLMGVSLLGLAYVGRIRSKRLAVVR
jgi:hypothetical protein